MTTTARKFTFEQYLAYEDGNNTRFELVDSEYIVLEIPEYWIVDPLKLQVTICQLNAGRYDDAIYVGKEAVQSQVFSTLNLAAEHILAASC